MRPCERCGGGALICSAVCDTPMRCPEPVYDDEFDMLGVCPHLVQCPACIGHPGDATLREMIRDTHNRKGEI